MDSSPDISPAEESYSISEIADLLGVTRQQVYRWRDAYSESETFQVSGEKRDKAIYYPRTQWDALLDSVGQTFPEIQPDSNGHQVIEAELMPEEVTGTLAKMGRHNADLQQLMDAELKNVEAFINELNEAEQSLSEEELESYRKAGAMKGIVQFRIETQAQKAMLEALRQKKMGGEP